MNTKFDKKNTSFHLGLIILLSVWTFFASCKKNDEPVVNKELILESLYAGETQIAFDQTNTDIPVSQPFYAYFNYEVDTNNIQQNIYLIDESSEITRLSFEIIEEGKGLKMIPLTELSGLKNYFFTLTSDLKGKNGETFSPVSVLFKTAYASFEILKAQFAEKDLLSSSRITDCPLSVYISITFSKPLDQESISSSTVRLVSGSQSVSLDYQFINNDSTLILTSSDSLTHLKRYLLNITSGVQSADGSVLDNFSNNFYTKVDPTPKFPVVSDEELLTLVQQQTFKYFWEFAHPVSGMARERNSSGDIVTSGGTGFGIMAIPAAIERGFISREEGVERIGKIANFLDNADRFHGAWSHWLNGSTGSAIAFSTYDNGGDLVETSYLIQGLLTVRQYLNPDDSEEAEVIALINKLWEEVEWSWYTRGGQNVLYWHWSSNYEWQMNMPIRGYNECLITYVLAASSPTFPIDAEVYHQGWAQNGNIINGQEYYDIVLPLGYSYGGPLFFAHYSFLGLDPRNLQDNYANYWTQNTHHSQINYSYCIDNPRNWVGYSDETWGLTASDNQNGYSAHSPTNDLGVITPTAAVSSLPYTPEASMKAIKYFYYTVGDKLWGEYGFYDAYNITENWTASSFLAIDQGPIIVMIENHRTALLWNLFMSDSDVQNGLTKLGFSY